MTQITRLLLLGALLLSASGARADPQKCRLAMATLDFASARDLCRAASDAGDLNGRTMMALMYLTGRGVAQDRAKGMKLLWSAARAGHPHAQYMIGLAYWAGKDLKQDDAEGVKWLRRAAMGGMASAQAVMAIAYLRGKGVKRSLTTAYAWVLVAKQETPTLPAATRLIERLDRAIKPRLTGETFENDAFFAKMRARTIRHKMKQRKTAKNAPNK